MSSLSAFPSPPHKGQVTLCEIQSHLVSGSADSDVHQYTDQVSQYPRIDLSTESLRPFVCRENSKNAFMHHNESIAKKVFVSWQEQGVKGVLVELANNEGDGALSSCARITAQLLLRTVQWLGSIYGSLFPHTLLSKEDLIAQFCPVLDWHHGTIRAFAWHPHTPKCAVALRDDSVRIFASGSRVTPLLKHKQQRGVADMAWKPYSASYLAVACQSGILLWQIEPTSLVTRPSSSCITFLQRKGHAPVTSVAWEPDGCFLVSASAADTSILIWDIGAESCTPMRRVGGGGVSFIRWSPDCQRLFAATPSTLFRIWETQSWTCERWSNVIGHCQNACWSPDGSVLLFTTSEEPLIYSLHFGSTENIKPHSVAGSKSAIPVADLTPVSVSDGSETIRTGGRVHQMVWDGTGERLAVSFVDNPELIAVFRTRIKPLLELSPCGFIRSPERETPQLLSFHGSFERGALLTVCWSSGKISNIPMLFVPVKAATTNGFSSFLHSTPLYHRGIGEMPRSPFLFSSPGSL
ncbi:aladin-like [Limulus polyphemus]|uniref:Aladin-like n=1 Tax=Limulus polyphemus TaxID=6850 RepID=A0ABM1BD71_LIMPO|nr:aladin-like [Limulus polyphemus]